MTQPADELLKAIGAYQTRYPAESALADLFVELLEEWPLCLTRDRLAGHLTGSAFVTSAPVLTASDGPNLMKVLLVHHRKLGIWVQPGGHADGVSDLVLVARTELEEETSLTDARLVSPAIYDLDRHEIPARPGVPAHYHFDIRYHFSAPASSPLVVSRESHDVKWVRLADLQEYTTEESIQRMIRKLG